MKIQDLNSNDSLFIELDLNEAANVGGGNGWSPMLFNDLLEEYFGTSNLSTISISENPNGFKLEDILADGLNNDSFRAFDRNTSAMLDSLRRYGRITI
jgi:hypothetical protein